MNTYREKDIRKQEGSQRWERRLNYKTVSTETSFRRYIYKTSFSSQVVINVRIMFSNSVSVLLIVRRDNVLVYVRITNDTIITIN